MNSTPALLSLIGNTPLIQLRKASEITGCTILGKAEFLNPGGSVKDRTALGIILDAADKGSLLPGGTIVEGTAGNTGIGISLIANAMGYRSVIVMPDTQSQEKRDILRLYGAQLHLVPAVPLADPQHYTKVSARLAEKLCAEEERGAIWADQFDNVANRDIHYRTTGSEIWQQTAGTVDGFCCAVGTGGTLAGVSAILKQKNPNICIALSDPQGASLYRHYTQGVLKAEGSSVMEGIGQSRVTKNLEGAVVDTGFELSDSEALYWVFHMLKEEGICLGGSSGINIAGAVAMAKELGPGHTIVTILCDIGTRYQSKLFNPEFLRSKGLPHPDWLAD